MNKTKIPDGEYLIRVIVREPKKARDTQYVRCKIKNGVIPSETDTIKYLEKRQGYSEGTQYSIKGISVLLDEEFDKFPDVMEKK